MVLMTYLFNLMANLMNRKVFLLDNQPNKGRLGYRVYQIIERNDNAVLVNLGWVQGSIDRNILPEVTAITGNHTITGHVREIEVGIQLQAQNFTDVSWPLRVQQIELDKFSQLIGKKLLPFVVYLDKKETTRLQKELATDSHATRKTSSICFPMV